MNVWGTGEHFECLEVGEKFDCETGKFPSKVSLVVVYAVCTPIIIMVLHYSCSSSKISVLSATIEICPLSNEETE